MTELQAVKDKTLSIWEDSLLNSIPRGTLHIIEIPGLFGRFQRVLDEQFEKELVVHCLEMQKP